MGLAAAAVRNEGGQIVAEQVRNGLGYFGGVRGLAAFKAVLVVLPLFGGNTAPLLDTCTVPLA